MRLRRYLSVVTIIVLFISCNEGQTAEELAQAGFLESINGSWKMTSAEVDDLVVTNAFPGLILTFQPGKKIIVAGAIGNIWPISSTFDLIKGTEGYDLRREDGLILDVVSLSNTELVISMTFSSAPGSRVSNVPGGYTFVFTR